MPSVAAGAPPAEKVASAPRGGRAVAARAPRGRPHRLKTGATAPPNGASAEEAALNGDDSTIIIPENETPNVPEDLFDENGGGNSNGRRKRRRRKR